MNKFKYQLLLCMTLLFCGCELFKEPPQLSLDKQEFEVGSGGGLCQFVVTANYDYEVVIPEECSGWISLISSISNGTVSVQVSSNNNYDGRTGRVEVRMLEYDMSETVTVVQKQKDAMFLDENKAEIPYQGGSFTVNLKSNQQYEIIISEPWIKKTDTKALVEDYVVFDVEENETFLAREAKITFRSENLFREFKVTQMPKVLNYVIKFTHDLESFVLPTLSANVMSPYVYWGDGSEDSYIVGLMHEYEGAADRVVELRFDGTLEEYIVEFDDIVGVKEIDLSGM